MKFFALASMLNFSSINFLPLEPFSILISLFSTRIVSFSKRSSAFPSSTKKPVVATNVGGNPEMMVDGKTGFLVEEGNADDLFEKLTILFENKEMSIENGSNGRKFIEEKFSMDASAKNFIRILDSNIKSSIKKY